MKTEVLINGHVYLLDVAEADKAGFLTKKNSFCTGDRFKFPNYDKVWILSVFFKKSESSYYKALVSEDGYFFAEPVAVDECFGVTEKEWAEITANGNPQKIN